MYMYIETERERERKRERERERSEVWRDRRQSRRRHQGGLAREAVEAPEGALVCLVSLSLSLFIYIYI